MGKKSGSGSGMNNPDHNSDSFETIFWAKILKFFDADPGWKNSDPRSGKEKNSDRSRINVSDLQHCNSDCFISFTTLLQILPGFILLYLE